MNLRKIPETQGLVQRVGEWAIRQRTFMPRMIDLEVSRICNLSCPACMRRADTSLAQIGNEHYCTLERFREIYKQIPTIGTLNFMGDGEPLMNPELNDIIHYASLNNIYTVITTNGTLIKPSDIAHWEENKVYKIHLSIDAGEELYEKMRVGASWVRTRSNLVMLRNSKIPRCLNMVLTNENIHMMPEMVKLAHMVDIQEITFLMPICAYGDDTAVRPENNKRNRELFSEAAKWCKKLGVKWIFPLELDPTFRRFSFPFIRPEISMEGDVWACCYSLGRGKSWVFGRCLDIKEGTYNMGNMFEEGFREIWFGEAYKELRDIYKRSEVPKGTGISKEEYLEMVDEVEARTDRFAHCEICPARWGIACS